MHKPLTYQVLPWQTFQGKKLKEKPGQGFGVYVIKMLIEMRLYSKVK